MVDVVGFSKLTTMAKEKGESGAEAIALEIGAYMGECIQIIEYFGGDVVKFLGDAVLVCFQPNISDRRASVSTSIGSEDNTKEISSRQKNVLVRKAVECGLQLLLRLSHYHVYLTAEERSKHRTPAGNIDRRTRTGKPERFLLFDNINTAEEAKEAIAQNMLKSAGDSYESTAAEDNTISFDRWNCFSFIRRKGREKKSLDERRPSLASEHSSNVHSANTIDLELHIALSCGNVTNVVLGDTEPDENMKRQSSIYAPLRGSRYNPDQGAVKEEYFLQYNGRLEYAIGGPVVEKLDEALSAAKACEMSITPEAYKIIQGQAMNLRYEKRKEYYIVRNEDATASQRKTVAALRHPVGPPNASYLMDKTKFGNAPLIPRIRNNTFLELSTDSSPQYCKYINRLALYRLQNSVDGNLPAQFRDVTIMFVSLGKIDVSSTEGLDTAQAALLPAIRTLVKYEGMLQQFAIDDKGATLLAAFGLPPLSHERDAVFAVKAAFEIRDEYRKNQSLDFAISLSTGVIFVAVVPQGNPFRRDPGISGDTIVLAVRMVKFPFAKKNIVCDSATKQQIGGLCEFEDMGGNYVKGKTTPIQIFGVQRFNVPKNKRISMESVETKNDFLGYKAEMEKAALFVNEWSDMQYNHMLIISGPSGVGKSFFCHTLSRTISMHDVYCCWSSSTEVEKSSKYYLLRGLLLSLFEIIDSEKVPQNPTRNSLLSYVPSMHYTSRSGTPSVMDAMEVASSVADSTNQLDKDWRPRVLSYASASPSLAALSMHNHDASPNEMAELICRCLAKCGESEGLLPVFKLVFLNLSEVEENKYSRRLDGRGRDILLSGVLVRMLRYVSEHVGLVFICDDMQWADSASIRILLLIHEQCSRIMILIATRPIRDYNVAFLEDFRKTGRCETIFLNGLGTKEIGEIILQSFGSGVERISPEIVRVVQKRTGGNPLYVKNMAIVLKDFNHVTVSDGELIPSSNQFDLEDLLGNFDYKRIIKMQFDRLNSCFQEFLTVASCLDQYFTVGEVEAVIRPSNVIFHDVDVETIRDRIEKCDVYHFLQRIENGPSVEYHTATYAFSHVTIPQSIYDMVSYETRINIHRMLAKYYERQLTRENYSDLLEKVTRHYLQTDWQGKQLHYLEALADLNMRSFLLPEATENLERIVKILHESEDLLAQFGKIHLSDIYRQLGTCLSMRTKLSEGERFLCKALECLGEPWPHSEIKFLFKFWLNRFHQYRHRKLCVLRRYTNESTKQIWKRVVDIMAVMSNVYFYTGNGRDFVYTCLIGLNACERINETGPEYTLFLARNSLLCWLNDEKQNSIYYISQALRVMDEKADPGTLTICAFLCFAAGKFKNACELLYHSIQATQTLGIVTDCQAFYRAVGLLITMRIFEGTLSNSPNDLALLRQMADTARCNGDYEAETWLGVYHVGNAIVTDQVQDCSPFVALLESHTKDMADYSRIAIHGTLMGYYARVRQYELARHHVHKLVGILPSLTVTPNIFPIFGLIFATMGLYTMVEDDQVDLVSPRDPENYDRFINGVARINHAFQQVKFWEFTQPALYLARALPYISTGRTVEGYMVLRHGVLEMHFIQEIRFLKAYYWANLGKYAFSAEDRREWTERAKRDFDILNIPSHVYCMAEVANESPSSLTDLYSIV
ncbi:hypothetical protein EC973_006197 [Apophysomyces ossiformis]|uniref:Guanylate cyclase domain-containing protein n=1 Tax=Apophysomyces ossiformis TaxID=679940 RepID=A0A8H7BRD1_9FUNG|nr:hypothetical protein EC973_006197 [Apophysomyces ossiformis]